MSVVTTSRARFRDRNLEPLWDKVRAGERLSREDGLAMFASGDLHGLGRMADHVMFLNGSQLVEWGETEKMFSSPEKEITGRYLNGDFG